MRQKITKPKQAASARQLDRWQRQVRRAIALVLSRPNECREELYRLLRSMQRSERR